MGRRERRQQVALERRGLQSRASKRIRQLRSDLQQTAADVAAGPGSAEHKLEALLDLMAKVVADVHTIGQQSVSEAQAKDAAYQALEATFRQQSVRDMFLQSQWRGCTKETVDAIVSDEIIRRSLFRSDVALAISAIDRIAIGCDHARKGGRDVVEAAHAGYRATLGSEKSRQVRERLLAAGFRGGAAAALEDTVCAEICDNLDHVIEVAKSFSVLNEFPESEGRLAGFRRRVDPEVLALETSDRVRRLGEMTVEHLAQTALVDVLRSNVGWPATAEEFGRRYKLDPEMRADLLKYGWSGVTESTVDEVVGRLAFDKLAELKSKVHATRAEDEEAVAARLNEAQQALANNNLGGKADLVPPGQIRCTAQSFDHTLMRVGADLWAATYAKGCKDSEAARICEADGRLRPTSACFAALWAVHAFQRLQVSHTFAAALMCTDVTAESLHHVQDGWRAWSIMVPNGLLQHPSAVANLEIRRILFAMFDGQAMLSLHDFSGQGGLERAVFVVAAKTVAELLTSELPSSYHESVAVEDALKSLERSESSRARAEPERARVSALKSLERSESSRARAEPERARVSAPELSIEQGDLRVSGVAVEGPEQRLILLARRLTAGLLLAMQNEPDVKVREVAERSGGYVKGKREQGEPAHRMVVVGRPLTIDCREGIENFIRTGKVTRGGRPGLPSVQWIVRGHYKHQVYGVGRLGRKLIWIQPFWKGKADAPILTHARKVQGGRDG